MGNAVAHLARANDADFADLHFYSIPSRDFKAPSL
jgi:hypothetical protein